MDGDRALRVALVDDQPEIRRGFRLLLEATEGMVVVGEAADGQQAVDLAGTTRPDVVLMDVRMPVLDGIRATAQICSGPLAGQVKVLILTTFDLDDHVYAALEAGASGFLLKNVAPGDLLTAIRVIAAGEALLAPSVTRRLIRHFVAPTARPVPARGSANVALDRLTEREREVLVLVAQGCSNDQIAARLFVSPATVKTHMNRLLSKLGCRDRAQLVISAYEAGLVGPYRAER